MEKVRTSVWERLVLFSPGEVFYIFLVFVFLSRPAGELLIVFNILFLFRNLYLFCVFYLSVLFCLGNQEANGGFSRNISGSDGRQLQNGKNKKGYGIWS